MIRILKKVVLTARSIVKIELTDWFPHKIKPVRNGLYQVQTATWPWQQLIEFETRVRVDGANPWASPMYNTGYMTNVAYDPDPTHVFSTNLNALDFTGKSVTYSLVKVV